MLLQFEFLTESGRRDLVARQRNAADGFLSVLTALLPEYLPMLIGAFTGRNASTSGSVAGLETLESGQCARCHVQGVVDDRGMCVICDTDKIQIQRLEEEVVRMKSEHLDLGRKVAIAETRIVELLSGAVKPPDRRDA